MKELGLLFFGVITGLMTAAMINTFFMPHDHARPLHKAVAHQKAPLPECKRPAHLQPAAPVVERHMASVAPHKVKPAVATLPTATQEEKAAPVVASHVTKKIEVVRPVLSNPPLPPPRFSPDVPENIETNSSTQVRVSWNRVSGAKQYYVFVEDSRGNLVKKYSTAKTDTMVEVPAPEGADPMNYTLRVVAVNAANVEGARGEPRPMKVKRRTSFVAPSLKQIVIEE